MRTIRMLMTICCLAPMALFAADSDVDYVLLPIVPTSVRGAFGSEWVTELTISNMSNTPVRVWREPSCHPACTAQPLPGETTTLEATGAESGHGMLAWIEKGRRDDLTFTLRTRDTSRQFETWGTVIPVVRPEQFFGRTFGLTDIPMESQFRATLRIYHSNAARTPRMRLRFYNSMIRPDRLIAEVEPGFGSTYSGEISPALGQLGVPSYAEIPLWLDPELVKYDRIRIELEPLDGSPDYWAFVSVTHNTTQHVTLILP